MAQETLDGWEEKLVWMEQELATEVAELSELYDPMREELETVTLRPRRTDIEIQLVSLAWLPCEQTEQGVRWLIRDAPG